jgi:ABC-type branched-subunit amino acid transport system permease subunit
MSPRKSKILAFALGVAVLVALPLLIQNTSWGFVIRILGVMGLTGLLALGVNMVLGYVGLLDLGFMAFYAIGAYTTALLSLRGWGFWACLPVSVALAMGVSVPSSRGRSVANCAPVPSRSTLPARGARRGICPS